MRPTLDMRSSSSIIWVVGIIGNGQGLRSAHAQDQQDQQQMQYHRCPCIRSTPWDLLSNKHKSLAQTLGYEAETWDMLDFSSARVESRRWTTLSAEKQDAAQALGYDDLATWDCCINHYEAYDYDELRLINVPEAFDAIVTLGYSKQYWNGPEWRYDPPLVEAKTWCDNVTSIQEDVCVNRKEIEALMALVTVLAGTGPNLSVAGPPDMSGMIIARSTGRRNYATSPVDIARYPKML
eukprot:CAMPEP_0197717878 /NCGR_PEP_ID=MMETSP1434-20131217/2253_1 /TAXON_ID=265543 /ORGANISM="Minutocellus polymorphus, Strain CCMP3303" /LENGTH=236 /DNA_ID=CAMNT_0043302459 /DNA_START=136 /DNA_END=847 /DNA_ORIENTATION=+